jgi:hypothetical protein
MLWRDLQLLLAMFNTPKKGEININSSSYLMALQIMKLNWIIAKNCTVKSHFLHSDTTLILIRWANKAYPV